MSKIKKLAFGVSWGAFSTITVTCFQLVFMSVMARMLDPSSFGLIAIANVSLRFFSYFAQMGAGPALIQKPNLEDGDIAAALMVSMSVSLFFFAIAQISAPLFEIFFQMAGLTSIIRVLALNFIIGGFSAIAIGLLQRKAAFRELAFIDVLSYVLGYGVIGIAAAYYGLAVWALAAAFITQMTLTAVLGYAAIRFPLSLRHGVAQRRHFLNYGGRYSAIGFTEFLTSSMDALVVGKLLGSIQAGYYNRATLLANLPVQQPANILTKALFPVMSSIGDQHEKQIIGLQLSILLVGSYAFAVSAGIGIASADIVKVLLGEKWLESIPIIKMLSLSVGPAYVSHVSGVTLDSLNQLRIKLIIQISMLILIVVLLMLAVPTQNVLNIVMAVVVMEWVRVLCMITMLTHLLRIPARDMVLIVVCIVIMAFITGLTILLATTLMGNNLNVLVRLCTEILAGVVGLMLGCFVTRYLLVHLPAIRFLTLHAPAIAKLFPKFI